MKSFLRRALVLVPLATALASGAPACAEPMEESSDSNGAAISAVDTLCTANAAQIGLSGVGAANAVAGYVTAAVVGVEQLVAQGASSQALNLARAFQGAILEIGGVTKETALLTSAIRGGDGLLAGRLLATVLAKTANSNVRGLLTLGFSLLVSLKDGLIALDGINPIGVQKNLNALYDGLNVACTQCGKQWACPDGVKATRLKDYDITKKNKSDSPAIAAGRECAGSTTFLSTSSYLNQCHDCCEGRAESEDSPQRFEQSCDAVCNAAYK
jgi:hypothetical protein